MNIRNNLNRKKLIAISATITIAMIATLLSYVESDSYAQKEIITSNTVGSPSITTVSLPVGPPQSHNPIQHTKVVIGVNNTVRWVNPDISDNWVTADNAADPNFALSAPYFGHIQPNLTVTKVTSVGKVTVYTTVRYGGKTMDVYISPDMKDASNFLKPGKYFDYTFTTPGTFGWHAKPWQLGDVTVIQGGK